MDSPGSLTSINRHSLARLHTRRRTEVPGLSFRINRITCTHSSFHIVRRAAEAQAAADKNTAALTQAWLQSLPNRNRTVYLLKLNQSSMDTGKAVYKSIMGSRRPTITVMYCCSTGHTVQHNRTTVALAWHSCSLLGGVSKGDGDTCSNRKE